LVLAPPALEIDIVNPENRSIFSRRPALVALLFYIVGILVSQKLQAHYLIPLTLTIASLIAVIYVYLKSAGKWTGWTAALLLVFLGWFNTNLSTGSFPPNHIKNLADPGGRVELTGSVVEEPDIREDRTYIVIETDSVLTGRYWIPSMGRVRAKVRSGGSRYNHADIVKITGYLYEPKGPRNPGGFDYSAYLRTRGIFAAMSVSGPHDVVIVDKGRSFLSAVVTPLRSYLISKTKEYLSPVPAAILSGFILGERRDIPEEYQTLFKNTGTLHLMAVSGSNVAMVIAIFAFPLALLGLPRTMRVIFLLGIILFFALLTRLEPSVVRASIMASVGLVAYGWIRKPDYINVLGFAGLIMLLWRPMQIFDVGLQLSFAATFAIIYALPHILRWLSFLGRMRLRWLSWILALSLSTVAAQLAVMPLMARYFNNIPLAGMVANIPVGVLAGLSTISGVVFYFLTLLGGWASNLAAVPLEMILHFVTCLLRFFSSLPHANLKISSPAWPQVAFYWILLYVAYEMIIRRRPTRTGITAGLVMFSIVIWSGLVESRSSWKVEFVEIGRNRAWIFSDSRGTTMACYDCYKPEDDPNGTLIPHILNFHGGQLDYLFSATADSPDVLGLKEELSSRFIPADSVIYLSSLSPKTADKAGENMANGGLPENVKVVWGESDNRGEEGKTLPALQVDAGDGILIFAGWSDIRILTEFQAEETVRLLEMPWSAYSKNLCRMIISSLNPEVAVFSPDRLSNAMPRDRAELTHSENRVYSASICGGFEIADSGPELKVRTMRMILNERE
jgi:ComEC/Rec2-related protein